MKKRTLIQAAAAAAASLAFSSPALAQDFPPAKPVTLVVGFAAGGAADAAARLIAKKLGENIGQTVVVDNKGGAGGNIAHQFVAKAPTDGSVLLFGSIGPLTIAPHIMKVGYNPFTDLAPISGGVNFPNVLVAHITPEGTQLRHVMVLGEPHLRFCTILTPFTANVGSIDKMEIVDDHTVHQVHVADEIGYKLAVWGFVKLVRNIHLQ